MDEEVLIEDGAKPVFNYSNTLKSPTNGGPKHRRNLSNQ